MNLTGHQAYNLAYQRYSQCKLMWVVNKEPRSPKAAAAIEELLIQADRWLDICVRDPQFMGNVLYLRQCIVDLLIDVKGAELMIMPDIELPDEGDDHEPA